MSKKMRKGTADDRADIGGFKIHFSKQENVILRSDVEVRFKKPMNASSSAQTQSSSSVTFSLGKSDGLHTATAIFGTLVPNPHCVEASPLQAQLLIDVPPEPSTPYC